MAQTASDLSVEPTLALFTIDPSHPYLLQLEVCGFGLLINICDAAHVNVGMAERCLSVVKDTTKVSGEFTP